MNNNKNYLSTLIENLNAQIPRGFIYSIFEIKVNIRKESATNIRANEVEIFHFYTIQKGTSAFVAFFMNSPQ